jgi:hypothetical protein
LRQLSETGALAGAPESPPAAIAAFAVVITTRIVVTQGKKLAEGQSELIDAKDRAARDADRNTPPILLFPGRAYQVQFEAQIVVAPFPLPGDYRIPAYTGGGGI